MLRSRRKIIGLTIASTLISATSLASHAQAETFSIGGKALNTNTSFRGIDGQPRVSIWDLVQNDPDQDFQRLLGNRGGVLLRNRTTGKCLNAYRKFNGAEFNTWPCDPNDPDQNWQINRLGGNVVQLQLVGMNLCIDTATRTNGGKVHLWICDANNSNQRWGSSAVVSPPDQVTNTRFQVSNEKFEVVLAAIRPGNAYADASGELGHVWLILVRRWDVDQVTYINNVERRRIRHSSGNIKHDTISALGEHYPVPQPNSKEELQWSSWWIQSGASRVAKSGKEVGGSGRYGASWLLSPIRLISYRKRDISRSNYYKYLPKSQGGQGSTAGECNKYELLPDNDPKTCNCSTFATRIYRDITGNQEFDNKIPNLSTLDKDKIPNVTTPLLIAQKIDYLHGWIDWWRVK